MPKLGLDIMLSSTDLLLKQKVANEEAWCPTYGLKVTMRGSVKPLYHVTTGMMIQHKKCFYLKRKQKELHFFATISNRLLQKNIHLLTK